MRGRRRTRDQALNSAQTRRTNGNRQPADKRFRRFRSALEFETETSARALEQFACSLITWTAFESGIVHPCYLGLILEKVCNFERTLILIAHPYRQRLKPAME